MSNISKVIYLTSYNKNIPNYVCDNWKKLNPDYEVKLYDNNDCIEFLFKEFGKDHVDIFNYIKDGPIKSDFFRVCILYVYGGVYSDIDIEPLVPIKDFLEKDVDFLTCDSVQYNYLNPHFIISVKKHPILKKCIDKYMELYMNEIEYSYWSWSIVYIMTQNINNEFNINTITFVPNTINYNILYTIATRLLSFITNLDTFKVYSNKIFNKGHHKYQFLQEHSGFDSRKKYCSYKGVHILNNTYTNYCRKTHKFFKNE